MSPTEFSLEQVTFSAAQTEIEAIRRRVFIEEQHVPESLEWDGLDDTAIHLLARDAGGHVRGTARLLADGHIGRMAVLAGWRRQGIGQAMLSQLLAIARQRGLSRVFLNAQLAAMAFYTRAGFQPQGETFMDAGIPHKRMVLELARID